MADRLQIALGIDIGGQTTRVGLIDAAGRVLGQRSAPTPVDGPPDLLAAVICRFILGLGEPPGDVVPQIGLALPGRIDPETGIMLRAVNLPALEGLDIRKFFEARLESPVTVCSDVSAAGFAQWYAHAPRNRAMRFVYLSFGTGVGGVAIIDGQIMDAAARGPAQFGHLIVDTTPDAPPCRCGARGCLEAIAGGPAVDRTGASDAVVRGLAIGLQQLSHLWAPDAILLGGGAVEHHPELVERSRAALGAMCGSLTPSHMCVETTPLKSDSAGVIGAALLAMRTACGATESD